MEICLIDAEGLDEEIRCEMCRNPMRSDTGCDGGCTYDKKLYEKIVHLLNERIKPLPNIKPEPERDIAKRVLWTGWKGHRDTRYKCPNCNKSVRNDDVFCHRCGQKLMFPQISWTPYVEGQEQELIVRWDDE